MLGYFFTVEKYQSYSQLICIKFIAYDTTGGNAIRGYQSYAIGHVTGDSRLE